jgi:chemotaxis protein methyltransferase CheR
MTCNESPPADFRTLVARRLGLWFDEHRRDLLDGVLRERLAATGWDAATYLEWLSGPMADAEWRLLAPLLTVTETYFLRGRDHFTAFVETVLPERLRDRPAGKPLRLLSAGCASGEEAYSMALLLREHAGRLGEWPVEILGVDLNREALAKARAARYSAWSLREAPPAIRRKYFHAEHNQFVLDETIVGAVRFEERNLMEHLDDLWQPGRFDVVFCRNVLMYFQTDVAARIVARIERALAPGGFLFLGHAETLRGLSQAFHLRWEHDTFFYQSRVGNERISSLAVREGAQGSGTSAVTAVTGDAATASDAGWMEEIGRASVRIAQLAESTARVSAPPIATPALAVDAAALGRVFDLQRQERFGEALARLQDLPSATTADADLQVLQAMLLVNCGRLAEAEALCRPLVDRDELNAGARYIAALCREHAGDLAAAAVHGAAAAYLDPTFAMAPFHLGLICKRTGRLAEAQAHFEAARALLLKEDPVRLLVFGGGFSREALIQVCQGEIDRARHNG